MLRRIILLVLLTAGISFAAEVTLPDLSKGNVNGLVGMLYWPASMPAGPSAQPEPLPSAQGCEAFLVPHDNADLELRYPCGKWFTPPRQGKYDLWLEMDGRMTPAASIVNWNAGPFQGRGMGAVVPVGPAGRVAIPNDRSLPENESWRLFSVTIRQQVPVWSYHWLFDRRVAARNAHKPVQMPAGTIVAGRFDRVTNDAIALSRPIEMKPGRTELVWPVPPVKSDVLIVLDKPGSVMMMNKPGELRLTLNDGSKVRPTDVLVNAADRIVAIWYGVDAPHATISLQSDVAHWPSREIRLTRGKVTTVRSKVEALPSAKVSINAPPEAKLPEEMYVEVHRADEKDPVRRAPATAGTQEITSLPPEPLWITLSIGPWNLREYADLTSGEDANVVFDLQPIAVSGRVYYGREPTQAKVEFLNGQDWVAVETNERGEYETTLWWPGQHGARVTLEGHPPFLDLFREILESGRVDFHLPRTDYSVRVRDAKTGRGIAGARVTAANVWTDETNRRAQSAQHVTTDDSGVAVLPPLREGELIVDVAAERYARGEPFRAQVDDKHHELELVLEPLAFTSSLRLLLQGGAPAARAEVWAFNDVMQPIWTGTAGDDGAIDLPDLAKGALLVLRHAQAASAARRWSAGEEMPTWTLDPPAEPLTLVAEDGASGAHVVLWLDGVKLSGASLAFAAWSVPATNPNGMWTGRNLPPKPLLILAVSPRSAAAIASRAFDSVARRVDYPWPAAVTARVEH